MPQPQNAQHPQPPNTQHPQPQNNQHSQLFDVPDRYTEQIKLREERIEQLNQSTIWTTIPVQNQIPIPIQNQTTDMNTNMRLSYKHSSINLLTS